MMRALSYPSPPHPSSLALLPVRRALNPTALANWDVINPCFWRGVTCNGSAIVGLSLPYLSLRGTLPSEVGSLTSLSKLNLTNYGSYSGYCLSGTLPDTLGALSLLTALDLKNNAFNGSGLPTNLRRPHVAGGA